MPRKRLFRVMSPPQAMLQRSRTETKRVGVKPRYRARKSSVMPMLVLQHYFELEVRENWRAIMVLVEKKYGYPGFNDRDCRGDEDRILLDTIESHFSRTHEQSRVSRSQARKALLWPRDMACGAELDARELGIVVAQRMRT